MSRFNARCALFSVLLLAASGSALRAQDAVYKAEELTERPQLLSPGKTAALIASAYTPDLRDRGITGTVQLALVIDEHGKVEAGSVKVVATTQEALGAVAHKVAGKLEFKPGKKDAVAVRTQVVLPLVFR